MKNRRKSPVGAEQMPERMNIRMSRASRVMETETAKINWNEMAKMLFRGDDDERRQEVKEKMPSYKNRSSRFKDSLLDTATDQMQRLFVLMFILTVSEKRSQELYQREFADRCDAISIAHGLADDEYWNSGEVPGDWKKLDEEFERRSNSILQITLREYSMGEIADQIAIGGPDEFMKIIRSVETQVYNLLQTH